MIHASENNTILPNLSSDMTYLAIFQDYFSVINEIKHFISNINEKIVKCLLNTIYEFPTNIKCILSPAVSLNRLQESF